MSTRKVEKLLKATAAAALLAFTFISTVLADELQPFTASYNWIWHGLTVAHSTLSLEKRDDNTWVYRSKSEPRGIGRMFAQRPVQESILRVTDAGVEPLSYKADDGSPSTKRDANIQFDWTSGRVTGVYEDTKVDMPLQPGIQDDLSVQIALMVELLRNHTPEILHLVDKNTVREYRYTREDEQTLSTPAGKVATVVYRSQKSGSPRTTRFWCAPSHGYIPLRVEQKRKGDVEWALEIQELKRD